ncbi:MAG TPA: BrxA/BrxB family bacilliredoxin [Thermoanaerobaculia bacterium]|nr:BrxA/BrxB family bacilliredoxin [Thermoanaerobaculia bacterium]
MYDEILVEPMRRELSRLGIEETRTAEEVDAVLGPRKGTVLVVVNSVCGCAAGNARPAVALALAHAVKPDRMITVFAGNDKEATARARSYFTGYRPSSPSIALLRDGEIAKIWERHNIEGRQAHDIAADMVAAFDQFCTRAEVAN